MGVFHQYPARPGCPLARSLESSGEHVGQSESAVRLARRPVGSAGFWRDCFCPDRVEAGGRCRWGRRPDCAVVLGIAHVIADDSAAPVPFAQFQRSQSAHPLSLFRPEWDAVLLSARFDTGATLFGNGGRGRTAAFYSVDVPSLALVWRAGGQI